MKRENESLCVSLSKGRGGSWAEQWKECVEQAVGLGRAPHLSGTSRLGLATV